MTVDINNKSRQRQLTIKSTQCIYLLHTIDIEIYMIYQLLCLCLFYSN